MVEHPCLQVPSGQHETHLNGHHESLLWPQCNSGENGQEGQSRAGALGGGRMKEPIARTVSLPVDDPSVLILHEILQTHANTT